LTIISKNDMDDPHPPQLPFPILFIKKKEDSLKPCINYWKLNQGTIKDQYLSPLFTETLAQLSKA
jgi:hypothetical protein